MAAKKAYKQAVKAGKGEEFLSSHQKFAAKREAARKKALNRKEYGKTPKGEAKIEKALNREERRDDAAARKDAEKWYPEDEEVLGRVGDLPEVDAITASNQAEADATQASQESEYERAKEGDAYSNDALERMKAGLGGFTAAENQALVEQAIGGADEDARNMMRQLGIESGAAGVTGSSLQNQQYKIMRNQALQRQAGRMEVLTANIAEKARRLQEYGGFAQNVYNTDVTARNAALDRLAKSRQFEQDLNLQADALTQKGQMFDKATDFDKQVFNVGQGDKELAGRIGTYYGAKGARKAARGSIRANRLAKRGYDIAEEGYL